MYSPWKDKNGHVVILQKPNAPLVVWFVSYLFTRLPLNPSALSVFDRVAFGALFTWAWMEIFSGVNLFRQFLGLTIMVGMLVGRLT